MSRRPLESGQRTAHKISAGSVCRHLKIAGRIAFFIIFFRLPVAAGHSCNTTSDFYGLRSGIIHGRRRGNKDPERASQDRKRALQVKTYDIAKATVLEHLKRGHMPGDQQWNEIVMGRVPADRFQKGGR